MSDKPNIVTDRSFLSRFSDCVTIGCTLAVKQATVNYTNVQTGGGFTPRAVWYITEIELDYLSVLDTEGEVQEESVMLHAGSILQAQRARVIK